MNLHSHSYILEMDLDFDVYFFVLVVFGRYVCIRKCGWIEEVGKFVCSCHPNQ